MDDNVQNANPTILNASDLPSRRRVSSVRRSSTCLSGSFHFAYPFNSLDPSPPTSDSNVDDDSIEEIDEQEIYDLISTISDPEHPLSLGSLAVINLPDIHVVPPVSNKSQISTILVELTPTVNHCSLATVIGLGVRVRLEQALSPRFRVDVRLKEGTHSTADAVNKQLADKERVAAALENTTLLGVIRKMLVTCQ